MSDFKGRITVQLKIYKGAESYDKDGNLKSEAQTMTLTYKDTAWKRNLDNLKYLGLSKVEVIDYLEGEKSVDIPQSVIDEVQEAFKAEPKKEKTAADIRIEELEAKNKKMADDLAELMADKKAAKKSDEPKKTDK